MLKASIDLSEWFANQFSENLIIDQNKDFFSMLPQVNAEISQKDLIQRSEKIQVLVNQGLTLTNLRYQFPLFTSAEKLEIDFAKSLDLLSHWKIKNFTFTDTSFYPGHDLSLSTRLSEKKLDDKTWKQLAQKVNFLGALVESQETRFMLANQSGTLIENVSDFEQLSKDYKYGFFIDVPHFLFINEKMDQFSLHFQKKVSGMRLGSYTPCNWVAARQNSYSWNESVKYGIFEPFKLEHQKMLKNFIRFLIENESEFKTISLVCERQSQLNHPLENFKIAHSAFSELVLSQIETKTFS